MTDVEKAKSLLQEFKGDSYLYGKGVLKDVSKSVKMLGKKPVLIRDTFQGSNRFTDIITESLALGGVTLLGRIQGARSNCPREDLIRIADELKAMDPDVVISFGGGSTIDAAKAAEVLRQLGGNIEDYFGVGLVTEALKKSDSKLTGHIAIQSVSSSAAHLTKYSNITDISTGQKKLIVDDAIIPARPVFDYEVTYSQPSDLTADGALDGVAHSLEVLYGSAGKQNYNKTKTIAESCIGLTVKYLPRVMEDPGDKQARDALCLATDLGGYAIMIGGTNGGHLTSFSLVDILSHGRACAIMNPYYTVFFAPAIEDALRLVGGIYKDAGLTNADIDNLRGRELGIAVAEAMFELARKIGFPIRLNDVEGFSREHIRRAIASAKNPQLKMKLQNMPIPITTEMIDDYMGPVLDAAASGDLSVIRNV